MSYFMRIERGGGDEEWPFMLKTHSDSLLTIQLERTLTQSQFGLIFKMGEKNLYSVYSTDHQT